MGHYDHREHAGNAGDLWKHFLLLEVADCLLTPDSSLVYAESHVGRPKYALKPSGDWESGIGRIWPALPLLKDFPYFDILAEANPSEPSSPLQIECYPGSALLLAKLAKRKKADLKMEIWDIDPAVEAAWNEFLGHGRSDHGRPDHVCPDHVRPDHVCPDHVCPDHVCPDHVCPDHGCPDHGCPDHGRLDRSSVSFHLGDGFSGCMSLLRRAPPGLLLIDPPFTSPGERRAAEELFCMASESGWTVLCWHMKESMRPSDHPTEFPLLFSQIGLDYAKAAGCSIRAASPHTALLSHLSRRARAFLHISASSK